MLDSIFFQIAFTSIVGSTNSDITIIITTTTILFKVLSREENFILT